MTEQCRLAAIVSADVAGYSRLMGRDESGTLAAMEVLSREVVDPQIAVSVHASLRQLATGLGQQFPMNLRSSHERKHLSEHIQTRPWHSSPLKR
jgi:hypothetical protein